MNRVEGFIIDFFFMGRRGGGKGERRKEGWREGGRKWKIGRRVEDKIKKGGKRWINEDRKEERKRKNDR